MSGAFGRRRWRLVRAGTDAVPLSVRRFMAARSRIPGARRSRRWALLGGSTAVVLLVGWALWSSSLLYVREVRVTGTEILSAAEVREAAAVSEQTPLLRVDVAAAADRVGALAPVAQVRVRRAWPHTVVVEVVERTPVAASPTGEDFVLIDSAAVAFQTVAQPPSDLPVVVLDDPGPDDPATRAALTVLAALTPRLRADLEALSVPGPTRIRLRLHSGTTIVWGDETLSDTKAQVATGLLDPAGDAVDGDLIDVSVPEVVSVR